MNDESYPTVETAEQEQEQETFVNDAPPGKVQVRYSQRPCVSVHGIVVDEDMKNTTAIGMNDWYWDEPAKVAMWTKPITWYNSPECIYEEVTDMYQENDLLGNGSLEDRVLFWAKDNRLLVLSKEGRIEKPMSYLNWSECKPMLYLANGDRYFCRNEDWTQGTRIGQWLMKRVRLLTTAEAQAEIGLPRPAWDRCVWDRDVYSFDQKDCEEFMIDKMVIEPPTEFGRYPSCREQKIRRAYFDETRRLDECKYFTRTGLFCRSSSYLASTSILRDECFPDCAVFVRYGKSAQQTAKSYKGRMLDGKRHGKIGVLRFVNGDVYRGQFKNDLFDGQGEYTFFATGDKYKGEFVQGQMTGWGRYYFGCRRQPPPAAGQKKKAVEGYFLNGVPVQHCPHPSSRDPTDQPLHASPSTTA